MNLRSYALQIENLRTPGIVAGNCQWRWNEARDRRFEDCGNSATLAGLKNRNAVVGLAVLASPLAADRNV